MSKTFHHPTLEQVSLDRILHALSDPLRRQIVMRLMEAPSATLSCNKACSVTAPSTLSFHMRILRESGLILSEKTGTEVRSTLRLKELNKRFPKLVRIIMTYHEPMCPSNSAKKKSS